MKSIVKVVLIIVVAFVILGAGGLFYMSRGLKTVGNLELNSVDVASLADGVYRGEYQGGRWSNEVEVSVANGKIVKIEVVEDVRFPKDEWTKDLTNRVIEAQDTAVEVISGATVTCNAYLKAIENALRIR